MKARFHLPDFTSNFNFNYLFVETIEKIPEYFYDDVEIASIYGVFPPSLWNGGRFRRGGCSKEFIRRVIDAFNEKGIPIRFTFTNPMLEKEHLNDEFCNMVLSMANNGLNEVIVVSPLLEDYIRRNYPSYKLTSSTCKRLNSIDLLNKELEKDYKLVVVDYDLNNRFDLLEQVSHKDKCELLVNACCQAACKHRVMHYRSIGLQQIAYCEHIKKSPDKPFSIDSIIAKTLGENFKCPSMDQGFFDIKPQPTQISPEDIREKYIPMGFSEFKIEGRTADTLNLMEPYLRYMVKPEFRDEVRLMLFNRLAESGAVKFNF